MVPASVMKATVVKTAHKVRISILHQFMDLGDSLEVCTLNSELSSLGLNLGPAINSHPAVSQAGAFINVCAVPRMDVKLGVPSAGMNWLMLKIP